MKKTITATALLATCALVAFAAVGCGTADPQGVTIDAAVPVVFEQPQSLELRNGEQSRGLSVTARAMDNGRLSYSWYSNVSDSNSGGTAVEGGNASVLNVDTSVNGITYYYCVITNTNGRVNGNNTASVVTDTAQVRVYSNVETPRIESHPENRDYIFGEQSYAVPLSVSAVVGKGSLSYQWYSTKLGSFDDAVKIEDATSAEFTPDISKRGGMYYYCEVTNTDETASEGTTVSVRSKLASITIDYDYSGFVFEAIDDETCKLTAYNGFSLKPFIPETDEDGRIVTELGPGIFASSLITEITIPDTVEKIGWYNPNSQYGTNTEGTFYNCKSLAVIHYNGKLKEVGDYAFSNCVALETNIWDFCDELEVIYRYVFQKAASLPEKLVFGENLTSIGIFAFDSVTEVKEISFAGNSVTTIGGAAFVSMTSLEKIAFPVSLPRFADCLKTCTSLKEVTIPRSIVTDGTITTGVPFNGTYPDDMEVIVPYDSYDAYVSSLGTYGKYVKAPPADVSFTLTIIGATLNGENSMELQFNSTLDEEWEVVLDDEEACAGWLYNGTYYETYDELLESFTMGYADTTLKALYAKDFTVPFTPSCNTYAAATSRSAEHVQIGDITATRYKVTGLATNDVLKIYNGSESHSGDNGIDSTCPVTTTAKSCLLMTLINNSDEAITVQYEVEYFGVLGAVEVELGAGETKTVVLISDKVASNKSPADTANHQLRLISGGENGIDVTIYGGRPA